MIATYPETASVISQMEQDFQGQLTELDPRLLARFIGRLLETESPESPVPQAYFTAGPSGPDGQPHIYIPSMTRPTERLATPASEATLTKPRTSRGRARVAHSAQYTTPTQPVNRPVDPLAYETEGATAYLRNMGDLTGEYDLGDDDQTLAFKRLAEQVTNRDEPVSHRLKNRPELQSRHGRWWRVARRIGTLAILSGGVAFAGWETVLGTYGS